MSQKKTKNLKGKLILSALLLAQFTQVNKANAVLGQQEAPLSASSSNTVSDSQNCTTQELYQKIQAALEQSKSILDKAEGKDLVLFLGASGAGKSTTINYLSDIELERTNNFQLRVARQSNQEGSAAIGHGRDSATSIPQLIDVTHNSKTYTLVDLPGFHDSRGVEQEIVNRFLIKQIIDKAENLKFVFIASSNEYSDQSRLGQGIKKDIETFKDLYPGLIESNSLIIATKCTYLFYDYSEEFDDAASPLESKAKFDEISFGDWTVKNRAFAIKNPSPEDPLGPINKTEKDSILGALESLDGFKPADKIGISKFPGEIEKRLKDLFITGLELAFDKNFKKLPEALSKNELETFLNLYRDNFFEKQIKPVIENDRTLKLLKSADELNYQNTFANFEKNKKEIISQTISAIVSKIEAIRAQETLKKEEEKRKAAEAKFKEDLAIKSARAKKLKEEQQAEQARKKLRDEDKIIEQKVIQLKEQFQKINLNDLEAVKSFAIRTNYIEAQEYLAEKNTNKRSVWQEAIKNNEQAAEQWNVLGRLYNNGKSTHNEGVAFDKDEEKAKIYFEKAAARKNYEAHTSLASLLMQKEITLQRKAKTENLNKALYHANQAIRYGNKYADYFPIAELVKNLIEKKI